MRRESLANPSVLLTVNRWLVVEIRYNHKPYDRLSDVGQHDDDFGPEEKAKFYMLSSDLEEFLARRMGPQDFLGRARILVDDRPVKIQLTEVSMPPRPDPMAPATKD